MLRLVLPKAKKNKKLLTIHLSETQSFSFTNKEKAQSFKVQIENVLNDAFDNVNQLFTQAHSIYRDIFMFIKSTYERREITEDIIQIQNDLLGITNAMYKTSVNGAYFIYNKLLNLFQSVKNILRICQSIAYDLNNHITTKKCKSILRNLLSELEFLSHLKESVFNNKSIKEINYELRLVI